MARPTDKNIFLKALEKFGNRTGNTTLQQELGWPVKKYWELHKELFDAGVIEKGRGYGGTVILVQPLLGSDTKNDLLVTSRIIEDTPIESGANAPLETYSNEIQIYQPVKDQLEKNWARMRQLDACHCEITALQGRRETGGSWSRPDLTVVAFRKYEFLPERVFELFSFEVKFQNDISVKGVMEALSHREAATRSFVIYYTAGKDFFDFPESKRIEELAAKYGVGIYAAKDVTDISTWAEIVAAVRAIPDPEALDTFIRRTLSDDAKTKMRKWF